MSSSIRRVNWNTRERVLSTDFNNATALMHRAMLESLMAAEAGDTHLSGVLRGLTVSVVASTLTVSVAPGVALRAGGTPATTYDSTVEWIEQRSAQVLDLASSVDGANPRWVVIEVSPNDATEVSELRDFFNPATGAFSAATTPKTAGSAPTFHITAGTPGATPAMPAGTAGRIPLALIYLPAAATEIDTGDIILCRPLLRKPDSVDTARGGGVSVAGTATQDATIHDMRAKLGSHEMSVAHSTGVDFSDADLWISGQSYPGSVDVVYAYACTPPYPSGYTQLASREFVPGDNIGPGGRIPSLPAELADNVNGCIVVLSTTAPSDNLDPIGDGIAGQASADTTWNSGTFSRSVYLGSVTARLDGTNLMGIQEYARKGEVYIKTTLATGLPLEVDTQGNASDSGTGDFRLADPLSASGSQLFPDTAEAARCVVRQETNGTSSIYSYSVSEQGGSAIAGYVSPDSSGEDGENRVRRDVGWVHDDQGRFGWTHAHGTGGATSSDLQVSFDGYLDAILAQR